MGERAPKLAYMSDSVPWTSTTGSGCAAVGMHPTLAPPGAVFGLAPDVALTYASLGIGSAPAAVTGVAPITRVVTAATSESNTAVPKRRWRTSLPQSGDPPGGARRWWVSGRRAGRPQRGRGGGWLVAERIPVVGRRQTCPSGARRARASGTTLPAAEQVSPLANRFFLSFVALVARTDLEIVAGAVSRSSVACH